ncbi:N-acetylglucosamine-6-phosphate deacetylase [Metabacillus iocasae]|uniref:N-acetylglucosamine-6-phosphate deacetylase n=1 Tax=Priestia iocasae TaxID=2291674 RepID=A0ABS2QW72_9BACI|nr:N-acetylglucosamine-6-phosphate deacetylase [Metabacillus iocasae]MBM7703709.1 N-acetylglucosamine-6-phosphate deacetylase [Metabacillus iocasae]
MSKESTLLLKDVKVYTGEEVIENGFLLIKDQKIHQVGDMKDFSITESRVELLDQGEGCTIIPGFIDLHIHGAAGADMMDATNEALQLISTTLPKEGTTSYLPTTMTTGQQEIEQALENMAVYITKSNEPGKAEVLGAHLEGPFLSPKRAGAQHPNHILAPQVALFKRWNKLANGYIKLVTLAPEQKGGLELVSYLSEIGVVSSIGHSDASYEEAVKSFEAGITHATHLYNQMRPMHHREPGVVGAVLLHEEVKCEIIADGIHSHPDMVKLAFRNKGAKGLILITDAMRAKCLGKGTYDLGGQEVIVNEHKAVLADGTLAGSILKLKDAALNMMTYTNCSLADIVQMTSINPAKQLGIEDRKGSLHPGKDADFLVLNNQGDIKMTYCRGELAYEKEE